MFLEWWTWLKRQVCRHEVDVHHTYLLYTEKCWKCGKFVKALTRDHPEFPPFVDVTKPWRYLDEEG